ncbi:S1C family serine protease [Fundicoccus culcitae]|uniref:Trypsin-like peptidase domain-containing protein n=1 Tax=Fundicoccus culcitae TaxID=2969821 RepID=A0ABY5P3K1_9LACT|nr:trypsin-like peptidase domain-containing protein [Fundicoccus culcitae]UUX33244.1 trypsin-like peptidase domain-containing protein [Fundicoccus culcitae]
MDKQNSQNRNNHFWKSFFGGALGSVITLIVAAVLIFSSAGNIPVAYMQEDNTPSEDSAQTLVDFESAIIGAVEKTSDAVVSVSNYQYVSSPESIFSYYSGIDLNNTEETLSLVGQGSGVVYKIEGDQAYIVTNNHVIEDAEEVSVIMANGEVIQAQIIGADAISDLAVLQIPADQVTTVIEFADSDAVQVGSLAIAIGSPLGSEFSSSVTQGIVSGVDRVVPVDVDDDGNADYDMSLLQTDAAINPGNSGGALVNKNGQLIGINSSKLSSTQIEGMGFAIPSNEVVNIIGLLEADGEVIRPSLGVSTYNLNEIALRSRVEVLGLDENTVDGVVVNQVLPDSSADKGGVEQYDVIVGMNDQPVTNLSDLRKELYRYNIGDTVTLNIIRNGENMQLELVLEATSSTPTTNQN